MDFLKKHKTIVIIAVLAIITMWGISAYNGLVSMDEGVQTKWADVETQYQRRADLIPNLVNTVKGYAAHESETLTAVVEQGQGGRGMAPGTRGLHEEYPAPQSGSHSLRPGA